MVGLAGKSVRETEKGAVKAPFFFFGCCQRQAMSLRFYCAAF